MKGPRRVPEEGAWPKEPRQALQGLFRARSGSVQGPFWARSGLAEVTADAQRGRREPYLDQEYQERGSQRQHRRNERDRDGGRKAYTDQGVGEEEHDRQRHHQARQGPQGDGGVDVARAPREYGESLDEVRILLIVSELLLERARPIDDARQSVREHAER